MQVAVFGFLGDGAGRSPVDVYVEELARAHDEGFPRVWTAQLPREPDLLVTLAVALREVPEIEVGTGVLPIQVEHPMAMAQRALTVNLISGGRLTLGIGLSHRAVTEGVWGVPWDRPIRRLGEYLDGLLPLLAGQKADAVGEIVTTRGTLRIPDAPTPDVYVAALGSQMLRLAGRRTAGTVTWMTGPRTLAEHVAPTLRDSAEEAGRPRAAVRVVASLPVSVTDEVDSARANAAEQFAIYGRLPSYRAMLDREGYSGPQDAAIIGDEKAVTERLDHLRSAGVDEFVGLPYGRSREDHARTRALLRTYASTTEER
ncbi:MAG: TIGR03564 family F420-dependent LLM class oxidoreductase [Pseudonocardia sp.]|nr:TIGR03564 family F420-dependent LLM class oxidoreductase [Pseudonocardia sp.]